MFGVDRLFTSRCLKRACAALSCADDHKTSATARTVPRQQPRAARGRFAARAGCSSIKSAGGRKDRPVGRCRVPEPRSGLGPGRPVAALVESAFGFGGPGQGTGRSHAGAQSRYPTPCPGFVPTADRSRLRRLHCRSPSCWRVFDRRSLPDGRHDLAAAGLCDRRTDGHTRLEGHSRLAVAEEQTRPRDRPGSGHAGRTPCRHGPGPRSDRGCGDCRDRQLENRAGKARQGRFGVSPPHIAKPRRALSTGNRQKASHDPA